MSPEPDPRQPPSPKEMVLLAEAVAENAYAPYSEYLVGAVVRLFDGREFAGVDLAGGLHGAPRAPEGRANRARGGRSATPR